METCPKNLNCCLSPCTMELIRLTSDLKDRTPNLTLGQQNSLNQLQRHLIEFELKCQQGHPKQLREIRKILQKDLLHTNLHHPSYIQALKSIGLTNSREFR